MNPAKMQNFCNNPFAHTSLRIPHFLSPQSPTSTPRVKMSSSTSLISPAPENSIVLGVGGVVMDLLAAVDSYPKPDDKIRSTSFQVQGGGNAGNAMTCAARLGLNSRLISKVADDAQGRGILQELEADGVNTSFIVVSPEGNSPFTYIIVDSETKTRTCIHTPGYPPMVPEDLSQSKLDSALDGARLVYSDVRLHETALVIAKEATRRNLPILVDAEKKREGLDELLNLATYVVCTAKFPQVWTEASSLPTALLSMLLRLPNVKFVIVTLGEDGCVMLERSFNKASGSEEIHIDEALESLKQKASNDYTRPSCVSSVDLGQSAEGYTWEQLKRYHPQNSLIQLVLEMHLLEQFFMLYVLICRRKSCCHLLHKWQPVAVELWEHGQVYPVTLILVLRHFYRRVQKLLI